MLADPARLSGAPEEATAGTRLAGAARVFEPAGRRLRRRRWTTPWLSAHDQRSVTDLPGHEGGQRRASPGRGERPSARPGGTFGSHDKMDRPRASKIARRLLRAASRSARSSQSRQAQQYKRSVACESRLERRQRGGTGQEHQTQSIPIPIWPRLGMTSSGGGFTVGESATAAGARRDTNPNPYVKELHSFASEEHQPTGGR